MNNKINKIKLDSMSLEIGETTREIECPSCGAKDGGFVVTRLEEGLVYVCHHASCGYKGFTPSLGFSYQKKRDSLFKSREYPNPLGRIPANMSRVLVQRYSLEPSVVSSERFKWDSHRKRLVMPIFDLEGRECGLVAKDMSGGESTLPKSITYWYNDVIKLHFPLANGELFDKTTVYVVEDILSAVRIAKEGVPSVAMLGSHLREDQIALLAKNFYSAVFAFDPDATHKAIGYANKFHLAFKGGISTVHLPDDPKDMGEDELKGWLNEV